MTQRDNNVNSQDLRNAISRVLELLDPGPGTVSNSRLSSHTADNDEDTDPSPPQAPLPAPILDLQPPSPRLPLAGAASQQILGIQHQSQQSTRPKDPCEFHFRCIFKVIAIIKNRFIVSCFEWALGRQAM